jgi:hypothetical protein
MSLINLSIQHGQTLEEAQSRMESAVQQAHSQLRGLVRRVEWSTDRRRVRLDGTGFWAEMWVDAQEVHVTGDIPLLGGLLGGSVGGSLKQIVQQAFQKKLT